MKETIPNISKLEGFQDLEGLKAFLLKFNKKFPFPFQSKSNENFYHRLQKDLTDIEQFIIDESKSISWIPPLIEIFQENKKHTLKIVESTLIKKTDEANNELQSLMEKTKLQETLHLDQHHFFRIRPNKAIQYSKLALFHISNNNRRNCKSYRYSTLGSPALYLGDSVGLCKSEVFGSNSPKNDFWISCFKNKLKMNLLSIKSSIDLYNKLFDKGINPIWTVMEFIRNLPITIACLYKTPAPHNFPFNPEYIVPQMLMNHVSKNDGLFGIKYPSTKFPYAKDQKSVYNYAFPMKKSNNDGYCEELLGLFDWTEPILSNQFADIKTLEYNLKEKAKEINIGHEFEKLRNGFRDALNTKN